LRQRLARHVNLENADMDGTDRGASLNVKSAWRQAVAARTWRIGEDALERLIERRRP